MFSMILPLFLSVININSNQNGLLTFEWTKSYKANQTALASIPRGPLPEGDTNASQQSSSNLPIIVGSVVGAAALVAVAGFLLYRRRTTQRKPVQSFSKPSEEVKNIPQALPQNANLAEPTQHPVLHLSQVYETASTRTSVISTQDHHNSPSHNTPFQNNQAPHLQHNPPVADIYSKHNLPSQYYQPYLDTSGQRNMLVLSSDPHPYMYPSSNRTSIASYSQPPMTYSNIAQQPQLYAPVTQTSKLHSQSSEAPPVEVLSSSSLPTTPTQRTNLPPTSDVSQQASNQEPAMPVYQPATPGPSNVKRDGHQYEVSPIQHQMR
ncbi:hypothetical protein BKA69DRAFT_214767 [Paraphysoderma sedebokerense]|nr:hypothetical protein BKA69DRAFT_214767 [Paraphysoderma sedebokerense]